jgi:hypothetical protein
MLLAVSLLLLLLLLRWLLLLLLLQVDRLQVSLRALCCSVPAQLL